MIRKSSLMTTDLLLFSHQEHNLHFHKIVLPGWVEAMTPEEQEQRELLLSFVEEGRELIDDAEPLIIELESQAADKNAGGIDSETINTIFRLFHSLKGGAGFLDLSVVSRVTHEAETLLDIFRKGKGQLTPSHVDLINRASDFLRKLLDQIELEFNEVGHEAEAEDIAADLHSSIAELLGPEEEQARFPYTVSTPEPYDHAETNDFTGITDSSEDDSRLMDTRQEVKDVVFDSITITDEILDQFATESEEQLAEAEDALIRFEKNPEDSTAVQEAFRALHSFKGNCGFVDFKDMMTLANGVETVLDIYRNRQAEYSSESVSMMLEIIDFLRSALKQVVENGDGKVPAAPGLLHLLEDTIGTELMESRISESDYGKQTEDDVSIDDDTSAGSESEVSTATESTTEPAITNGIGKPAKQNTTAKAPQRKIAKRQSVRVDVEKVDKLLNLVGELVIAEAMVSQNPDLRDVEIPLDRFEKAVVQLNKITRDLQDISTSIRMIPLSGTFRRMHRLVRDLAQKSNKTVELEIEGEETEVDKTVIENITDPLVHILRNSIDHGIETPEERIANGKESTGHVAVKAFYVGGEVWITIRDDGQGLNRERILNKALQR